MLSGTSLETSALPSHGKEPDHNFPAAQCYLNPPGKTNLTAAAPA